MISSFFDYIVSNEDVENPKPSPQIYLKCMSHEGIGPNETLILEDSPTGRRAAMLSGANLCPVKSVDDVNIDYVMQYLNGRANIMAWKDNELNIVIPMAGAGSRFEKAGYTFPKPLIEVKGKPMIQLVVENINIEANYIYIVQKSHYEKYQLNYLLNMITPNCKIICIDGITEGAACTVLCSKEFINNDKPLLIANSDQWIKWNSSEFMYQVQETKVDGCILTFESMHPKWSYVVKKNDFVESVHEKQVVSSEATVGIYYYKKGSEYVSYAEQMINNNKRVNNEFYVCPIYNEFIADGKKITTYPVEKMYGIGTPEDLDYFIENNR